MKDGPLDMRFNKNIGIPVKDWLINASREEIQEILYKYGDEKHAKLISSAIYVFLSYSDNIFKSSSV